MRQIAGLSGGTNIVFTDKVMATLPGDQVYKLSAAALLPVGAATANYQGEAIFVGNRGRPVSVSINATSACRAEFNYWALRVAQYWSGPGGGTRTPPGL